MLEPTDYQCIEIFLVPSFSLPRSFSQLHSVLLCSSIVLFQPVFLFEIPLVANSLLLLSPVIEILLIS